MKYRTLALIAALVFLSVGASAQTKTVDATVFGFHLGEKLTVPECPFETRNMLYVDDSSVAAYLGIPLSKSVCFEHSDPALVGHPLQTEHDVRLQFPDGASPAISGNVYATVIDGSLEAMKIWTPGYSVQASDLNILKAKYGTPSSISISREQNSFAAQYENVHARWHRGDVSVAFDGVVGRVDQGLIVIGTKKGSAFLAALAAQSSGGPKL
jgi:hypothetical protein